ncbi:MAG: family 65 glycosyl hydrolase [Bacteroidales bacterium]|nr:family 65 glycosyl hydrolase [Bacteroidales bacterium]
MGHIADKYFKLDPWAVIEEGFDPKHGKVAESIFSLGNEYMGVRGHFDEGYSGPKHVGSYFNGFYESLNFKHPVAYNGFVLTGADMTNTVDWLYTRLEIDGEVLDLATSKFSDFRRVLDLKTGVLTRTFVWETKSGKKVKLTFERFTSLVNTHLGGQKITFEPLNFSGDVKVVSGMDFSIHADEKPNNWNAPRKEKVGDVFAILGETKIGKRYLCATFRLEFDGTAPANLPLIQDELFAGTEFTLSLQQGKATSFRKLSVNYAGKVLGNAPDAWTKTFKVSKAVKIEKTDAPKDINETADVVWNKGIELAGKKTTYDSEIAAHKAFWANVWDKLDIVIEGDDENQQGIRYCIFQLHQTYHGSDPTLNIGAKGLTGDAYGGKAFWDTEAYCLAFYIFNNPEAAKNLLEFRYSTLEQARIRARVLDCAGACYPIATIDGWENCELWQHASLQIHVSGSVAFGIEEYDNLIGDKDFLYGHGAEMLMEIARFYVSRAQQDPHTAEYGFYGVMGVDEFHVMTNNNCFVNYLAKKSIDFALKVADEMKQNAPEKWNALVKKINLQDSELKKFAEVAGHMKMLQREDGVFEQHDGFFNLPHIDLKSIKKSELPLYDFWAYDRIYRTDMVKQPDVLMFLFMYAQDFSREVIKANYEYYEPICMHESSLSPSIHSVIAAEIGKHDEAASFFGFATRLDLDDYNNNTYQGLHTTSISAAWTNIVYGFGGMRTDRKMLAFSPSMPKTWKKLSFKVLYQGAILSVVVDKKTTTFKTDGKAITAKIYGKEYSIDGNGVEIAIPDFYIAK